MAAAFGVTDREGAAPSGEVEVLIGGWATTVGVLVEGTLTVGTLVEGTLTVGTLTPGTLTPGTLTPGTLTPGTDTASATALTEAPSAAPQRAAASAVTVVCRRLRRDEEGRILRSESAWPRLWPGTEETARLRAFSTCWKGFLQSDQPNWTQA
jgi:hypothetical protein